MAILLPKNSCIPENIFRNIDIISLFSIFRRGQKIPIIGPGAAPPLITKKVVLIWIFCTVLWQTVIFYIFCTIFKWFLRPLNSDLEQTYLNNFDRESSQLFKSVRNLKIGGDLAIQYIEMGHPRVHVTIDAD